MNIISQMGGKCANKNRNQYLFLGILPSQKNELTAVFQPQTRFDIIFKNVFYYFTNG